LANFTKFERFINLARASEDDVYKKVDNAGKSSLGHLALKSPKDKKKSKESDPEHLGRLAATDFSNDIPLCLSMGVSHVSNLGGRQTSSAYNKSIGIVMFTEDADRCLSLACKTFDFYPLDIPMSTDFVITMSTRAMMTQDGKHHLYVSPLYVLNLL
jgi:hypothetical protein